MPDHSNYDIFTEPNHDGWGPDTFWDCIDWINWHKAMVDQVGREEADTTWVKEYDLSSYGAHEIICATANAEFKDYVKANGLDKKSTILTKVYRASDAIETATAPVKAAFHAATDLFDSIGSTAKIILPVAAGILILILATKAKAATT